MRKILILVLILSIAYAQSNLIEKHKKEKDFLDLSKKHNKKYASTEETLYRFSVFKDNLKRLEQLRANHPNAQFELNHLFDKTHEEFVQTHNGARPELDETQLEKPRNLESIRTLQTSPSSYDLRQAVGAIPIRNQGSCGSCYAFSSVASIEYAYLKKFGIQKDFSEQQLVDCGYPDRDGCQGGWMPSMFNYINQNGLTLEQYYPYTSVYGTCYGSSVAKYVYTANPSYGLINSSDESIKQALLYYGALSGCVDADSWSYYSSGIFSDSIFSSDIICNHAINIIGYGIDPTLGIPYYIIRNSWGTSWGENGYIRLDGRRYSNGNSYGGLQLDSIFYTQIK